MRCSRFRGGRQRQRQPSLPVCFGSAMTHLLRHYLFATSCRVISAALALMVGCSHASVGSRTIPSQVWISPVSITASAELTPNEENSSSRPISAVGTPASLAMYSASHVSISTELFEAAISVYARLGTHVGVEIWPRSLREIWFPDSPLAEHPNRIAEEHQRGGQGLRLFATEHRHRLPRHTLKRGAQAVERGEYTAPQIGRCRGGLCDAAGTRECAGQPLNALQKISRIVEFIEEPLRPIQQLLVGHLFGDDVGLKVQIVNRNQ